MGRLVSVVVVTWNSAATLQRCLDALAAQTHTDRELIIVDNASADGCADFATIRNDANLGFSKAVNQGLEVARGEFVLLLNPDCFLAPDYVSLLIAALDDAGPRFGAATGKLLRDDGSGIDSMGIRMTRSGRHFDITSDPSALGPRPSAHEVFGVSGAAAFFRRSFLDDCRIDGEILDEDFFAYREDADLAWRGRLFGWRALCEPRAIAHHVRRVTPERRKTLPPEINLHGVKNRFLLRLKNEGVYLTIRNAPFELFRDVVVILATLTVERSSMPALTWLWRNRTRVLTKRREIQRRRRVSDRELARWFT